MMGLHLGFGLGGGRASPITNKFLASMGYTRADYIALSGLGIKDCAPWCTVGRALNGPLNGEDIAGSKFAKDYNAFVHVNDHKWRVTEPTEGVFDYSKADSTTAFALAANPSADEAFHGMYFWDNYNADWVDNGTTSGNLAARITARASTLATKYPGDPFFRIDVLNEHTDDATSSVTSYAADRGLRTTANALYTAGLARDPADRMKWARDAFVAARTAFPTARLAWVDNELEACFPPETFVASQIPGGGNMVYTDGRRNVLLQRANRLRYEIWDARRQGAPVDAVGYQLHISPMAPQNFDDLRAMFWDYNRWGVVPIITELNTPRLASVATLPPIFTEGSPRLDRYMARTAGLLTKEFVMHSACDEVTQWNAEGLRPFPKQVATEFAQDFPIRAAVMLALKNAVAPGLRDLKRGTRVNGGYALPPQITFTVGASTGVLTNGVYSYINGLTGTGIVLPWTWMKAGWMTRPASDADIIMTGQFIITGTTNAGNKVLMGIGNTAANASPTDRAYIFVSGQSLVLNMNAASAGVAAATMATGLALNTPHRFAIRINGTAISYSVNGGAVATVTASGAMAAVTGAYLLSRPNGIDSDPEKRISEAQWLHGPDYPTNADLIALSTVKVKDVSLPFYDGA